MGKAIVNWRLAQGKVTDLLADTGYFSTNNVSHCKMAGVRPSLAVARDHHHRSVFERFAADSPTPETVDLIKRLFAILSGANKKRCAALPERQ